MTIPLEEDKTMTKYSDFLESKEEKARLESCFTEIRQWITNTVEMTFVGKRDYEKLIQPMMRVLRASLAGDELEFSNSLSSFHHASKEVADELGFTMPEAFMDIVESILGEAVSLLDTMINRHSQQK